jgi:DNA transformation protein
MSASEEFLEHLKDGLRRVGTVSVRRMFGGAGIYVDGRFIAIVDKDVVYLKTDDATRGDFDAEGCGPFVYHTKHGPGRLDSYRRMPERLLDDADELAEWAQRALAVARRAAAGKKPPSRIKATVMKKPRGRSVAKRAKRRPPL